MADDNLDFQQALDAGTKKMDLSDLEKRGFKRVKVLDEKTMEEIVRKAVDRVASTRTGEEKERILAETQKELDRLMKEHRAVRTKAQLLESNKNELAETIHALQRELELKSELEEERLHKKFVEGTASMQKQVEEIQKRAQDTGDKLERLRVDNAKLQAMYDAENEKVSRLEVSSREVQELNRQNARYQTELESAGRRLNELEGSFERERLRLREAEHARTEMVEQVLKLQAKQGDAAKTARELENVRGQLAKSEEILRDGAKENASLKARLAEFESRIQETQAAASKSAAETARLEGENDPLRKEVAHLRSGVAALEATLAEERSRAQGSEGDLAKLRERLEAADARMKEKQAALDRAHSEIKTLEKAENEDRSRSHALHEEVTSLRKRLDEAESRGWDNQEALARVKTEADTLRRAIQEERSKAVAAEEEIAHARKRADESKAHETELQARIADADRVEVERVHLEQELARVKAQLSGFDVIHKERDQAVDSLEKAMADAAALRQEIARRDRDQEAQRDKIVVVTSDLEEIEKKYSDEQQELGGLREKAQGLEEALANTQGVLAQTHGEMQSLQEILQREQDANREMQVEYTSAQSKLQEVTSQSARLEEQVKGLLEQNNRLKDRLNKADITTAATQALDHRLATVERLMDQARQQTGDARAAAGDSKAAAEQMRKSMVTQAVGKRKTPSSRVQGGVAIDGHALLQEFFRRIRLKERLQKHVPIQERDGQRHPSELLQDVVSALMSGDRRPDKEKGPKLEILGGTRGPDISDLRQFLDRIPPRASHAVSRVHDALRHNLFSIAERPGRLVLDIGSVDLPRQYRPLVAYEPESKEFWHGELRTVSDKDTQGIVPFLKECVSKVPGGFPRSRVRFRLDSRYFSEDAVRFLNGRGCGYVMEAPDLKPIREAAKKAKYRELSGGWEAGEFAQRIHPIRKTAGRFVAVRHRLSRKGRPEKPMFRDQTWEYCVYVVDSKISPWRAYQTYAARPAAQAESASMLSDFTKSKLLGRRRRSHGALFPLYLMASDLVQWFRRKALPMEERGRDLDSLRTELLKLPTTQERMGLPRLPVLAKRDKTRKSFERVARKIKRLRPVRPFKFRK